MTAAPRFSRLALEELDRARILGVRAGTEHRYTGVWVVVVEGRVFVRSWNDKPTGWYRAFQAQPLGSIQLAGREIDIRARRLRGDRLRDAVTRAYAGKYDTKASERWCVVSRSRTALRTRWSYFPCSSRRFKKCPARFPSVYQWTS